MLDAEVTEFYHNQQEMLEGDQESSTFNCSGLKSVYQIQSFFNITNNRDPTNIKTSTKWMIVVFLKPTQKVRLTNESHSCLHVDFSQIMHQKVDV